MSMFCHRPLRYHHLPVAATVASCFSPDVASFAPIPIPLAGFARRIRHPPAVLHTPPVLALPAMMSQGSILRLRTRQFH